MKIDFILIEIIRNAELGKIKKVIKLSKKLKRKSKSDFNKDMLEADKELQRVCEVKKCNCGTLKRYVKIKSEIPTFPEIELICTQIVFYKCIECDKEFNLKEECDHVFCLVPHKEFREMVVTECMKCKYRP